MERKRFDEIDFIKAVGIIGVIAIHILTYSLTNPLNKFLWNNLQFVVMAFVFSSGFVLANRYLTSFTSITKTLGWYKKRLLRLIIPFYIYLIAHYSLWILFPHIFGGLGLKANLGYFVKSAFLFSGTNYNFLPLLFIQFTILFPFFAIWIKKKKVLAVYIFFSLLITAIFTMFKFPYEYYRQTMWVPWSLILLLSMYVSIWAQKDKSETQTNKRYLVLGVLFFVLFLAFYILNFDSANSLNFYDHKYPPDFYYLSFGTSITFFAILIGKLRFWQNKYVKSIYYFISINSYAIFFIHYIILDAVLVLAKQNSILQNPVLQFIIVFFPTIFILLIYQNLKKSFKK